MNNQLVPASIMTELSILKCRNKEDPGREFIASKHQVHIFERRFRIIKEQYLPRLRSPIHYAALSPMTTRYFTRDTSQTTKQPDNIHHGHHPTRLSLECTTLLTLLKWLSHQRHLRRRERRTRLLFAAPLLHQLDQSHSRWRLLTELKHYMHMVLERLSHSITQRACLEIIRASATDGLSYRKNQLAHCHGFLQLRGHLPLVCSNRYRDSLLLSD